MKGHYSLEKTYNARRRGHLIDNSLSADSEGMPVRIIPLTIRVMSSLLRLLACIRIIVSRRLSRNCPHRFVTLPAASGDDPATEDFGELRGGASDEVT